MQNEFVFLENGWKVLKIGDLRDFDILEDRVFRPDIG